MSAPTSIHAAALEQLGRALAVVLASAVERQAASRADDEAAGTAAPTMRPSALPRRQPSEPVR